MPRKTTSKISFNNESDRDGGKSAQDILTTLDTNFSRAEYTVNKYQNLETPTNSIKLRNLNQNKATGAISEITTITQVNSGASKGPTEADQHGDQSEQRGGSTMSDLHNTEYVDESRATRSHVSPKTMTSKGSESPRTPRRRKVEVARAETSEDESSENPESMSLQLPPASSPPPTPKKRSKSKNKHATTPSAPQVSDTPLAVPSQPSSPRSHSFSPPPAPPTRSPRSKKQPAAQSQLPPKGLTMKRPPSSEKRRTSSTGDRRAQPSSARHSISLSTRSNTSEEETGRGSEQTGETEDSEETESETYTGQPFMDPDPTAARDLDNASPKTIAMCNRYACHYCFFVYFPPSSVDEDLMPFRRKAFVDKVGRLQNPEHVREVMETKCARDAYTDRRITSIERQSGTEIRLSELDPGSAFVKGLPRRRLTIAGPSFAHIGCALNLFESLLPKVVKTGIFPYRLPEGSSTRFSSGMRQSSQFQWSFGRQDGTVLLRNQLDDKGGWRGFLVPNKAED